MPRYNYEREFVHLKMPRDDEGDPSWVRMSDDPLDPTAPSFHPPPGIFVKIMLHADEKTYRAQTLMLRDEQDEYTPGRMVFVYRTSRCGAKVAFSEEVKFWKLDFPGPSLLHFV